MDKNTFPSQLTPDEILNIIHELREYAECHEQLPKNMNVFLKYVEELQYENMQAETTAQYENMQAETTALTSAWLPDRERGEGGEYVKSSSSKVRRIGVIQTNPSDLVTRLRCTWLGRIYITHLKQYVVIRWMAIRLWRNGYPIYVNHISTRLTNRKVKRWRALTRLNEFTKRNGIPTLKLADPALVDTPAPKVFPTCDQSYLISPHNRYTFPEIFVATINNAITYGGTNLILVDDKVIGHDAYDFERDYTSEELHGRTLIDPKSRRIRWLLHDRMPDSIPVAATFVDACASNYAHWLTEVLPRIAVFCAQEQFSAIPIIVNDGLHKNIMESLILVAGNEREIIALPIGRALQIDMLYLTSVAGYVPFDRRNNKLSNHSHGVFSPTAFDLIRKQVTSFTEKLPEWESPEKIYLRRNSGMRKVMNSEALENLLVDQGFVIVEPEKLSFIEQVLLFRNTKEIISPTGAALSNAIFCKPGARIGVLMAKHENMIYRYWSNMLFPLGVSVSYVLGEIIDNSTNGIHADFNIDKNNIYELLESWKMK